MIRVFLKWFVVLTVATHLVYAHVGLKKADIYRNELRLHFDKPFSIRQLHHFTLKNPYREVFDLKGVRLSSGATAKRLCYAACRRITVAQYDPQTVRVVIEPFRWFRSKAKIPRETSRRLHLTLPVLSSHSVAATKKNVRSKHGGSYCATGKELIVIDAGHGGHDTGAIGGGKREKDLVLQIAKRVERRLKKMGYRVYMTRRTDVFLKLPQRTRIADRKNADIFVSIHANSVPKSKRNIAHGVETYFLQKSRDAKSQRIAARENAAVLKGAKDWLSKKIIIDSVLNGPKIIESNKLALDVQSRIIANLRAKYRGVKDGGVRPAPFWVLVGASRPSILVEVGYISNPRERRRLFTPAYQERIAKGIAEGIRRYLYNHKCELGL